MSKVGIEMKCPICEKVYIRDIEAVDKAGWKAVADAIGQNHICDDCAKAALNRTW